jgi:Do/DeqQ family serine protease
MTVRNIRAALLLSLVALLIGVTAGSYGTAKAGRSPFVISQVQAKASVLAKSETQGVSFAEGFSPVVKRTLVAVVNIASSKVVRVPQTTPFLSDPLFKQFFGDEFLRQWNVPREQRERSLGSGVIVRPDGYILTNNHVVEGATDIRAFLGDNRPVKARILGQDPKTDIAVLKIDAANLPVLAFANSSEVRVGDFALAIGNPFGVGQTVTMGIISATGRGGLGIEDYEDFIQTDAAINPGNSGGALINVRGELIGINAAIVSGSGGSQGVGFAIPANMARSVMDQILKRGRVIRGWLGLGVQPVTTATAKAFGLPGEPRGALIADVSPGSPADRGGLLAGDIILEMDGTLVKDSRDLSLAIAAKSPGTAVQLKAFRGGREREFTVTLGEQPEKPSERSERQEGRGTGAGLGLSVQTLTPEIARQLGLESKMRGIVVTNVDPAGPGEGAGITRGDIILEANRRAMNTAEEFQTVVREAGKKPILLLIQRSAGRMFVVVEAK